MNHRLKHENSRTQKTNPHLLANPPAPKSKGNKDKNTIKRKQKEGDERKEDTTNYKQVLLAAISSLG